MSGDVISIVLVGVLSLAGAVYSARSARHTTSVTVDVRIFEALQEDVVRLQERVETLRAAVRIAEDDTDAERAKRRAIAAEADACARLVERMAATLRAAGLPVPTADDLTNPKGYRIGLQRKDTAS